MKGDNHGQHYKAHGVETIEKIRRIWGNAAAAQWCEITAFKYRDRIGLKASEDAQKELEKIEWYEAKARELRQEKTLDDYIADISPDWEGVDVERWLNENRHGEGGMGPKTPGEPGH